MLEPMNHQQQTFNNCGPASIATILGYYGQWVTQYDVNQQIEAGSISGATEYLAGFDLMTRAFLFPPSVDPTRLLLANGIPVIVNQFLTTDSDIRHYRIVHGYDDETREFVSDDPLLGASYRIPYTDYRRLSRYGIIVPVYPIEMDTLVQELMAELGLEEGEV
jgi:ABC-type bacteriocin/lantibiotic exporter with double-glycine peptidase domain